MGKRFRPAVRRPIFSPHSCQVAGSAVGQRQSHSTCPDLKFVPSFQNWAGEIVAEAMLTLTCTDEVVHCAEWTWVLCVLKRVFWMVNCLKSGCFIAGRPCLALPLSTGQQVANVYAPPSWGGAPWGAWCGPTSCLRCHHAHCPVISHWGQSPDSWLECSRACFEVPALHTLRAKGGTSDD